MRPHSLILLSLHVTTPQNMIRTIKPIDALPIFKLGESAFDWRFEYICWNEDIVLWFLDRYPEISFVYLSNDVVEGFCLSLILNHSGYICWVAVEQKSRRNGIARSLINQSVCAMRDLGCTEIGAHVRVDGCADSLFGDIGFEDTNEVKKDMKLYLKPTHTITQAARST